MKTNLQNTLITTILVLAAILIGSPVQAQTLVLGDPTSQIISRPVRVSPFDGTSQTPLVNFTLSASGSDVLVKTVESNINWTSTASTMYLFSGSTLVAATSAQGGHSGTFNVFATIPKGTTVAYTIKADFGTNTPIISPQAWTSVGTVTFETPAGTQGFASGSVNGNIMYFFGAAAEYKLAATASIQSGKNGNGSGDYVTATFPLLVTALGGNVTMPVSSDFVIRFTDLVSSDSFIATAVDVIPNSDIAEGSVAQVVVTATLAGANVNSKGMYVAKVQSIRWTIGSSNMAQSWGLDEMVTPITNVSTADMNKLTVIDTYFHDEQSSERDNTFIMTFIVPKGMAIMSQYSSNLSSWSSAGFQFGSGQIATLHNGNYVMKGLLFASRHAKRGFYRIIQTQ